MAHPVPSRRRGTNTPSEPEAAAEPVVPTSPISTPMAVAGRTTGDGVIRRKIDLVPGAGQDLHIAWGDGINSSHPMDKGGRRPILIEMMDYKPESVAAKVNALAESAKKVGGSDNRAMMVGVNAKAKDSDIGERFLKKGVTPPTIPSESDAAKLAKTPVKKGAPVVPGLEARKLAALMDTKGVRGGIIPFIWAPTTDDEAGYTFPFLEARAMVTKHAATQKMIGEMAASGKEPVIRSMDGDVTDDPLLINDLDDAQLGHIEDLGLAEYDADDKFTSKPEGTKGPSIVSGGYNWDTKPQPLEWWAQGGKGVIEAFAMAWNHIFAGCLRELNTAEHNIRLQINEISSRRIYWPEPNTYQTATDRRRGADRALKGRVVGQSQQRESSYYMDPKTDSGDGEKFGVYDPGMATTKPIKDYFDNLRDLIKSAPIANGKKTGGKKPKDVSVEDVKKVLINIRQMHLNKQILKDIAGWHSADTLPAEVEKLIEKEADTAFDLVAVQMHKIITSAEDFAASAAPNRPPTRKKGDGDDSGDPSGNSPPSSKTGDSGGSSGKDSNSSASKSSGGSGGSAAKKSGSSASGKSSGGQTSDDLGGSGDMVEFDPADGLFTVNVPDTFISKYVADLPHSTTYLGAAEGHVLAGLMGTQAAVFNQLAAPENGGNEYVDTEGVRYRLTAQQTAADGNCLIHGLSLICRNALATPRQVKSARAALVGHFRSPTNRAILREQAADIVRAVVEGDEPGGIGPKVRGALDRDASIALVQVQLAELAEKAVKKEIPGSTSKSPTSTASPSAKGQQVPGKMAFNVTYNDTATHPTHRGHLLFVDNNHYVRLEKI